MTWVTLVLDCLGVTLVTCDGGHVWGCGVTDVYDIGHISTRRP